MSKLTPRQQWAALVLCAVAVVVALVFGLRHDDVHSSEYTSCYVRTSTSLWRCPVVHGICRDKHGICEDLFRGGKG